MLTNDVLAADIKNLVKTYNGMNALDGIGLKIKSGEIFAILGPNGAGKTTLMRILTTQLRPTEGEALVSGYDTVKKGSEIRKIIGYVPQEMSVWTDITGYENLLIYYKIYGLPSKNRKETIRKTLDEMGLYAVANNLVHTYSGGMIRRLEIACAMMTKPKILFLDEPTIGLDPSARKVVWEKLTSFKKDYGTTIIFNTHYMNEADEYADEIAILMKGRIIKLGTAKELKKSITVEIVKLELSDVISADSVDELKTLGFVKDVAANGKDMDVFVDNAEIDSPILIEKINKMGVKVVRISIKKPTLDDVFLKYVGTKLETRGTASEARQTRKMITGG